MVSAILEHVELCENEDCPVELIKYGRISDSKNKDSFGTWVYYQTKT